MANQLAGIMQDIANLIRSHQDSDAVAELYAKMRSYEKKFPQTVRDLGKSKGTGTIWFAVMLACDDSEEEHGGGGHE